MTQPQMTRQEMQRDFMYLFERMSEPLGMGMKGPSGNMVYYTVPADQLVSFKISKTQNTVKIIINLDLIRN